MKRKAGTARNYARGAAAEHAAGKRRVVLADCPDDWHYVRTAGSHSPTDVVLFYKTMWLGFWDGQSAWAWVARGNSPIAPSLGSSTSCFMLQLKPSMAAARRAARDWASGKTWEELLAKRKTNKSWQKALAWGEKQKQAAPEAPGDTNSKQARVSARAKQGGKHGS